MNTTGVQELRELNQRLAGCSRVPRRGVLAKIGEALQEQRGEAIRREISEIEQWLDRRLNLMNYQGPGSKEHEMRQRLAALRRASNSRPVAAPNPPLQGYTEQHCRGKSWTCVCDGEKVYPFFTVLSVL